MYYGELVTVFKDGAPFIPVKVDHLAHTPKTVSMLEHGRQSPSPYYCFGFIFVGLAIIPVINNITLY